MLFRSRATKGTEANTVASTIEGSANNTWKLCPIPVTRPPNQPVLAKSTKKQNPTTGESTGGKCSTIIADGQACDVKSETGSCDDYAKCISGTCQIFDPSTCK